MSAQARLSQGADGHMADSVKFPAKVSSSAIYGGCEEAEAEMTQGRIVPIPSIRNSRQNLECVPGHPLCASGKP